MKDRFKQACDFLVKAKPTGINMGRLFPLHGTKVYEEAKEAGTLIGNWGVLEDFPRVKLPWFNRIEELYEEHRKVTRRFWLNPGVIAYGIGAAIRTYRLRISKIIDQYTREAGVRNLEREIASVCRKLAKEIVLALQPNGKRQRRSAKVTVTEQKIEESRRSALPSAGR